MRFHRVLTRRVLTRAVKGEGIYTYVTLNQGVDPTEELRQELRMKCRAVCSAQPPNHARARITACVWGGQVAQLPTLLFPCPVVLPSGWQRSHVAAS